jgi:arylsulfatase A-like enzyme
LLVFSPSAGLAAPRPPNIVFILIDDLGWADLGCYGSKFYQTPNVDRLAREGMRFTQAYAAAPICSPTRASILTGKYPARLHLTDWLPGRGDRPDQKLKRPGIVTNLPASEIALAEALKSAGYVTAHIGKWHLGGKGSLPQDHGFDVNIAGDESGTALSYFGPYKKGDVIVPGLEDTRPGEYLTDRLTSEAVHFIEVNRAKPFFLYLAHYAVHIPLTAKTNVVEKYLRAAKSDSAQTNAIYAAMIESVDQSVGRILRQLDALSLSDHTVFVFTSDNGGLNVREGPATPSTSNAPLRAGKGYLYEGGLRVPLIVRWPGVVAAGKVSDAIVSSIDFYSTLLELAGVGVPDLERLDGASFVQALKGGESSPGRTLYWHYPHYSNQGGKPGGAIRQGNLKLIESYESGYLELYNLKEDVGETNDLAAVLPEAANALAKQLADWRRAVGAQMMTTNLEYEPVPLSQSADGSVTLSARDVTIHGTTVRYEPPAHKNTIGYWTRVGDWVSWDFAVTNAGWFSVTVLQGCGKGSGGSEVEVSVGDQKLRFVVQETGHFQNFVSREIGRLRFVNPGRYTLAVKPLTKPGVAVMDLRQVTLLPARN